MPHTSTKVAEIRVAGKLKEWSDKQLLPNYSTWNKQNPEADAVQCGRYRPDFLWELDVYQRVVILEVDEHAHRHDPIRCELTRMIHLAIGFGGRPVHIVRYNPDLLPFVKTMPERKEREALLLERMTAALAPPKHDDDGERFKNILTVEWLYYYDIPGSEMTSPHVQMMAFKEDVDYEAWAEDTIAKLESVPHRAVAREAASN
jgi:hypothetical protein